MSRRQLKKPMAEINIVPYVDVMLVLLVIFMITAPLLTTGVEVNLPKATAKAIEPKQNEPLVITVDNRGKYYLNIAKHPRKPIDLNSLKLRVAAELQRDPSRQVMVRGDESVNYGKIITAMVELQSAGAETVGLVTKTDEQVGRESKA